MPAIDFPASPSLNDEYTFEGRTWLWNGTGWEVKSYPAALQLGSASAPSLYFTGDPNTGLYSPGADQVALSTGGTGRLFVDATGSVSAANVATYNTGTNGPQFYALNSSASRTYNLSASTELAVERATTCYISIIGASSSIVQFGDADSENVGRIAYDHGDNSLSFNTNATERARIDSSGRLLVGTSAARSNLSISPAPIVQVESTGTDASLCITRNSANTASPRLAFAKSRSASIGGNTIVISGDSIGEVLYSGNDGANFITGAAITAEVDGTPGLNDMPGRLVFSTTADGAASPTERMRIDSSGRLLLGTSTVANNLRLEQSLAVVRTGSGYGGMSLTSYVGTAAGTCPVLDLQRSRGTTDGSLTKVQSGDRLGVIVFRGANGTTFSDGALIDCWADDEWNTSGDTSDSPGRLSFWTTPNGSEVPAERMRITSGGFVKVSNTGTYTGGSQNYHEILSDQGGGVTTLIVSNSSATAQSIQSELNSDGTTYSYFKGYSISGGANRIIIYSNGNVVNTNNSYGAISDIKLKENIVDANSQWDDIKALQVRNYNFKEGQTHTQIGLVAQEAELVSPGLITESPDRDKNGNDLGTVTKSVNYSVLYMKAVKALQEAMERIEQLEAEMAEVKAQLS